MSVCKSPPGALKSLSFDGDFVRRDLVPEPRRYLLFHYENNFLRRLVDVVQTNDAGRLRAKGQQSDFVSQLGAAVRVEPIPRGVLCRVEGTGRSRPASIHFRPLSAVKKRPVSRTSFRASNLKWIEKGQGANSRPVEERRAQKMKTVAKFRWPSAGFLRSRRRIPGVSVRQGRRRGARQGYARDACHRRRFIALCAFLLCELRPTVPLHLANVLRCSI